MIVEMSPTADRADVERVRAALAAGDSAAHAVRVKDRLLIVCAGPAGLRAGLENRPGVHRVIDTGLTAQLASRALRPAGTVVQVGDVPVGGHGFTVIAGPCAVESADQLDQAARAVASAGAALLRGGAYKPRTSPYSFQGLGLPALQLLARQRETTKLGVVTEATQPAEVAEVARWADAVQIGSRNMQNFALLREAGRCGRPVLLKRGMAATVEEWLGAAEYVLHGGNLDVMLCERGVRAFGREARFTLDLSVVPIVKRLSHLPVIVDPSHATGDRALVGPMALAAAAAGADGILVDVHAAPSTALCDGAQALMPADFSRARAV